MSAKSYIEKLKDPRWQKVRLEVLQRDRWGCVVCSDGEKTLHVHHGYYQKGMEPWEYPIASLQTLCEECHVASQQTMLNLHKQFGDMHPEEVLEWLRFVKRFKELWPVTTINILSSHRGLSDAEFRSFFETVLAITRHR